MSVLYSIDERVKYMKLSRFKAKVKSLKRCEIESFKHLCLECKMP